jgi:hypothetical protein
MYVIASWTGRVSPTRLCSRPDAFNSSMIARAELGSLRRLAADRLAREQEQRQLERARLEVVVNA